MTLDKLPLGQEAVITAVGGEGALRCRLLDMVETDTGIHARIETRLFFRLVHIAFGFQYVLL